MKPKHHPNSETILAYAAGSLEESFSLTIAAHVERCPICASTLDEAESFAGSMLEALPRVEMNEDSFSRVINVAENNFIQIGTPRTVSAKSDLPPVLMQVLPDGLYDIHWRFMAPGIHQHRLSDIRSGGGSVRMLRIAPGVKIPEHTHAGSELTLILSGSYTDQTGRYGPGDLADMDSSVHHSPVVDSGQPCICLIATDRPLQFSNRLNRMFQPLIGI